jgi:uncharacterized protein (TIGR00375 family)
MNSSLAMPFVADLHTHSKYAQACSHRLTLPNMQAWAQIKGVELLSCADFTHPAWFEHLQEVFEEVEEGVFSVQQEHMKAAEIEVPESCQQEMRFVLGTELSLIYKRHGRGRKVHLLVYAPNMEIAMRINRALEQKGNLSSDGRPIIGLDSEELMKILIEISPNIEVVPAHVWTPWFGVFGSKSGFDSLEECFGSMTKHIHALETGLSSDPAMNARISKHDELVLVSNSDAHSPQKFGREATLFETTMDYPHLLKALREDRELVAGTLEFFPEEGKYHADGLRKEGLWLMPEETKAHQYCSPATGKPLTVGVLHRIDELADRKRGEKNPKGRPAWHIIPLPEILSEITGVGVQSKTVETRYFQLIEKLGPEFRILKDLPLQQIRSTDEMVGEAIDRMRKGQVHKEPGYDGEYGKISLFSEGELKSFEKQGSQMSLL